MRNVCPKKREDYHQEVDVSYCTEEEGKGEEENDIRGERGRNRKRTILGEGKGEGENDTEDGREGRVRDGI